jgi:hypothetical protein
MLAVLITLEYFNSSKRSQKDFCWLWINVVLYHMSHIRTDELTKCVSYWWLDDLKNMTWKTTEKTSIWRMVTWLVWHRKLKILLKLLTLQEHLIRRSLVVSMLVNLVIVCVVLFFVLFVCLRLVSCVPNVASVSGFSNLDFPFVFL